MGVIRVKLSSNTMDVLIRRGRDTREAQTQRKGHVRTQGGRGAGICKPGRGASGETNLPTP